MRSVWNGTIAFGQVAIPVKAYGATKERGSGLHQLHVNDGGRVRLQRVCEVDGAEVPADELGRGFDLPGGEVVVLSEDDMAGLPVVTTHAIEVCAFVPLEQIDPTYFVRHYYLEPQPEGLKPYVLLGEALDRSGRVALVKIALRQRESLAMLRVRDRIIVLTTMLWPDEIRAPEFSFLDEDVALPVRDLHEAGSLVERLSADFAPDDYADEYRDALRALISARAEAGMVLRPKDIVADVKTGELVDALAEGARSTQPVPAPAPSGGAVSKAKAAARRAAAAKAAATRVARRATKARRTTMS